MNREQLSARLQEYFNGNRYNEAVRFLENLLQAEPEENRDGCLDYHLGRIFYFRKDFTSARKHFLAAITINSEQLPAKFFLARTLETLDEKQDLLRLYADCLGDRPKMKQIGDFISDHLWRKSFSKEDLHFLNAQRRERNTRIKPLISIIILCYNKADYTEKCLASIFQHEENLPHEVIVLDNASVDDTPFLLETYTHQLTYVRSDTNLGFVGGNNEAVRHARGDYLIFLNNDTVVSEGWLAELYACFQLYPDAGAVGAKLIYPDGRLQEAGGIVFSDGNGWNYGRGMRPEDPRFDFVREVDYCSAAALMLRGDLWKEIGGFDQRYTPAYYEDTDLCFEIRKRGYKVYYQPKSRVIHHEGKTAGTDLQSGYKKYQTLNRVKFLEKWSKELQKQHSNTPTNIVRASNRQAKKSILVIDSFLPFYDRASGSLRLFQILKLLKQMNFHITFLARNGSLENRYRPIMEEMGIEVYAGDAVAMKQVVPDVQGEPVVQYDLLFKERHFEFALIEFWDVAEYYLPLIRERSPRTQIIVDTVDIHFLREIREADLKNSSDLKNTALRNKQREIAVYRRADRVWVVTEKDREAIGKLVEGVPIDIVPNVHKRMEVDKRYEETSGLLFIGNFNHPPNRDAVGFFCKEILPLIRKEIPDLKLYVVGNNPTDDVKALASGQVIVTGYLRDLSPLLRKARISVNPLRFGAGMKGKIGEALSWGLPVVTTSIGAEGMGLEEGWDALIADSAKEFADKVTKLYKDRELWNRLSEHGKEKVEALWSPGVVKKALEALLGVRLRPSQEKEMTSIIILVYNQLEYTQKCLDSIFRHTREPFELITIDNGSADGTADYLNGVKEGRVEVGGWKFKADKEGKVVWKAETAEAVKFKGRESEEKRIKEKKREKEGLACQYFKVIHNKENLGFAEGCNQGIDEARGEFLLLLNNDVLVTENWLASLLECLQSESDIGIVGPMTNHISGPQQVPKVGYSSIADLDEYARSFRRKNRYRRIPFHRIVGFCMLFRRVLVEQVGLLDESFGTGNFEDDDFCLRAELAGYRNMIAGDVFIHHFGSRSFIGNKIDYRKTMKGNQKFFQEKWNSLDPKSPEGKKYLSLRGREAAKVDYEKGQAKKAVERWLAVIRLGIGAKENYYDLADLFLDTKQYDQAIRVLEQVPEGDPDERKYALLGYCQEGLANPLAAQKLAEQALSLNPSNAPALNLKGILSYRKGDKEEAQDYFQRAAASDPPFGEPHTNLGVIRWEDNRQKEALQLFERGFILSPTITDILQLYHTAVTQTGEFSGAEQNFYEAKALHPFHQGIRFFLIDILLKQERYKAAMEEIEQAMGDFAIEDEMLKAALAVRKRIGPLEKSTQGQRGRISLCMIAKDEEKDLVKCLQSVKPVVDEIIVVDTGSADRTKDIATALGAKVFEFSWEDDFSAARNFSISQAKGDWILVLDADEVISPLDHASLLKLTKEGSLKAGYSFVTRNYLNTLSVNQWTANNGTYDEEAGNGWIPSEKVRLFPRDRRIHFENPVHEFVEPSLERSCIPIKKCSVTVHHYGKLNEKKEEKKGEDYFLLGKKKLEKSRGDLRSLRELAVQAHILKRDEEAAELWRQVIRLQPNLQEPYVNLTSIYMNMGKFQEASAASQKAIELDPNCKEAVLNYSIVEFALGNLKKVIVALENLLSKIPEYPLAMGLLSVAYRLEGEIEKSQSLIVKIKKAGFDYEEYLENTANHLIALGRSAEAGLLAEMMEGKEHRARFQEATLS